MQMMLDLLIVVNQNLCKKIKWPFENNRAFFVQGKTETCRRPRTSESHSHSQLTTTSILPLSLKSQLYHPLSFSNTSPYSIAQASFWTIPFTQLIRISTCLKNSS